MIKPDYANYTLAELIDCQHHIDAHAWPERVKEIDHYIGLYAAKSPEHEREYKQAVFNAFCDTLRRDLAINIDDNILWFLRFFSKRAKALTPSTFADEVCPLCHASLHARTWAGGWELHCKACDVAGIVVERYSV